MAAAGAPAVPVREPLQPLAWACAAFSGGVLLHIDAVPAWAAASALALVAWRLTTARTLRWAPGTATRALLALALVALVLMRFHTLNGLAAGTTLLMLMSALKLLETRTRRDQWVMVGAGLFLLLAACLDRQSLARTPLYALQAWLCCAALAVIAAPKLRVRGALMLAARALGLAVPLAALLFLFFPRLPGSFWAIPRGAEALTGLSETMDPGSIVELVASYDPAFRVHFSGAPPPREELYWRGPVLHEFDGRTWRRSREMLQSPGPLRFLGRPYRYHVWLEPSRHPWWFALDTPADSPDAHVLLTYDYLLVSAEPVVQPVAFDALSYTHTAADSPLDPRARRQDTRLRPDTNPRTAALARALWLRSGSDSAFVRAALEYLRTGGFVYSLTPAPLGAHPVDEFLFDTREGFCGHYASAFVTLMRAAGVPARVVTGYLGGEWNPAGGYLIVRQADAHAWAEVWLSGRGWTRIDPTAVVAPERLRRGILELMPGGLSARERLLRSSPWLVRLLQRWDVLSTWWGDHVVNYDYQRQLDLLSGLGVRAPDARHLGWAFALALLGWLALVAWHFGRGARRARADALARAYSRLCRKLARIAPARAPHQGPLSLAATISAHRPDLGAPVRALLERYAELRYGRPRPSRARDLEDFRRAVAQLRLPRHAAQIAP
jgi:protein-glutamine gamma-glutamyltransferase